MVGYFGKIPASNKKPSIPQQGYFPPLPHPPTNDPQPSSSTPQWPAPYPGPYPYPPNGGILPHSGTSRMPHKGPLFGSPAAMSTAKTLTTLARKLAPNDYVEVNLRARGWVLGVVISICELANAVCNWSYKIRFPSARGGEEEGMFAPDQVREPSRNKISSA